MADRMKIDGPVKLASASVEAVAFDLMFQIAIAEKAAGDKTKRDYWLKLYEQCRSVVSGSSAAEALKTS